jgi:hypothetical protein
MSTYDDNLLATRFAALAPEPLAANWDEVLKRAGARKDRRRLGHSSAQDRRRRLVVLAAALLVVVVGAASAFGTVRGLFGDEQHFKRSFFDSEGKRGSFGVRILSNRSWRIVPEPVTDGSSTVAPTGQYVQVTGRGRVVRIGGHAQAWSARLEGFVTRPGEAKQRVVITMKRRPQGVFVLTPLQRGTLKRDSGTLTYTGATG